MSDVLDEAWFRAIYQQVYQPMQDYLCRRIPSQWVESMLSVVLTRVWDQREHIPEEMRQNPLPWIYGVARTVVSEFMLLLQQQREEIIRRNNPTEWETVTTEIAIASTELDPVTRALQVLAEPDREILTLAAWEGFSTTEIAPILNISPAHVRVRLHRARGRLATLVDAFDVDEGTAGDEADAFGTMPDFAAFDNDFDGEDNV